MDETEELYPCVGICSPDPDSGYCLGCGRPPLAPPGIVAEEILRSTIPANQKSDTPE
jgi:hypothetical protein